MRALAVSGAEAPSPVRASQVFSERVRACIERARIESRMVARLKERCAGGMLRSWLTRSSAEVMVETLGSARKWTQGVIVEGFFLRVSRQFYCTYTTPRSPDHGPLENACSSCCNG